MDCRVPKIANQAVLRRRVNRTELQWCVCKDAPFEEVEDDDSVVHKEKAAEKKGTQVKKNKVRGESNQEKDVGSHLLA